MAASTITRTADTDDDGTGTTGTIRNAAWKTAIYQAIDDLFTTTLEVRPSGATDVAGVKTGSGRATSAGGTIQQGFFLLRADGGGSDVGSGLFYSNDSSSSAADYFENVILAARGGGAAIVFAVDAGAAGAAVSERARITLAGNLKVGGTASRATTEGTKKVDIFDGTAPVGTLANGISLYSTAGELRVMDAGGTATLLSPHDHGPDWVFLSENKGSGKYVRIEVEKLLKHLNRRFGKRAWVREVRGRAA